MSNRLHRPTQKHLRSHTAESTTLDQRLYVLGIVVLLISIPLHQPLLLVVGFLLLLVLATTDIWVRYCLRNVTYQRRLSEQRVLFGEEITLAISIENSKLLPLPWLELEDGLPRALTIRGSAAYNHTRSNRTSLQCLFSLRWYERVTRQYTVQCASRGVYAFGPSTLRSGDVFGFLTRKEQLVNEQYILVYPLIVPLTSFNLPVRHPFGDHRAQRRLLEDPSRVIGVRDYAYGDSLRRLDWKATARTMQLQSKVYESTTTYTLALFLNVTFHMDTHYGIHPELQELSICAAASITDWSIDQGYAVGLYVNTVPFLPDQGGGDTESAKKLERRRIRLPAASSEEQRKRIMEALARIKTYVGSTIEETITAERSHLSAGATVVVITTAISERLVDTLASVRQAGHSVTILFAGNAAPPIRFSGIHVHHLGGDKTWETFMQAYTKPVQSEEPGFNL